MISSYSLLEVLKNFWKGKAAKQTVTMFHWASLPAELRLMILNVLVRDCTGLASYASVCKEWQVIIEKKNFRRLKLGASCLDDFEKMTGRCKGLIKHVWLNIELHRYTCRCCVYMESYTRMRNNNTVIQNAISKLFSILSKWNQPGNELTLELSSQSPSDSEHWFKNCYFGVRDEDEDVIFGNQLQDTTSTLHDPKHGWVNGQQVEVSIAALNRLYEHIELDFRKSLPEVHSVTRFILRRQCRRRFSPKSLSVLLHKLPRLEHIIYEPWRAWYRTEQKMLDKGKHYCRW